MQSLQEFVDYVWLFYAPDSDLYPIKGLTKQHIFDGFYVYKHRLLKAAKIRIIVILGDMVIV